MFTIIHTSLFLLFIGFLVGFVGLFFFYMVHTKRGFSKKVYSFSEVPSLKNDADKEILKLGVEEQHAAKKFHKN